MQPPSTIGAPDLARAVPREALAGGDQQSVALSVLPLARLAMEAVDLNDLFLPMGWDKLANIASAPRPFAYPGVKGFLAQGRIAGDSGLSAVMALGIDWADWLSYYNRGAMAAMPIGAWSGAPPGSTTTVVYNQLYAAVRSSLWDSLRFLSGMRLRITGMSLGGPLALLAALDLRAGNLGPSKQSAPGVVDCQVFSTGATSNQALATYFATSVPACSRVTAGTATNPVDFFPRGTTGGTSTDLGADVSLPTSLPADDEPWLERAGPFYERALGGTPVPPPTQVPTVAAATGFERPRAFLFARLSLASYQRFQHPSGTTVEISPFSVGDSVTANGVNFCTLFTSVDAVVAAIRGTCTWQEFADLESNSQTTTVVFGGSNASVHGGARALYAAPAAAGGSSTFAASLKSKLTAVSGGKPIYLVGHGFGGAVASQAALDLSVNAGVAIAGLYTFGSIPAGGPDFAALAAQALPNAAFHVARDADRFTALAGRWVGYASLATPIAVTGVPANDSYPNHSVSSYAALLDPSAGPA